MLIFGLAFGSGITRFPGLVVNDMMIDSMDGLLTVFTVFFVLYIHPPRTNSSPWQSPMQTSHNNVQQFTY